MIGDYIEVSIDLMAQDIVDNHLYLFPLIFNAAGFAFVMAHEVSKGKPWHNQDPLWEFLRHCRNAIAHNGKWHFLGKEPAQPAQWGPFLLGRILHGTPIFKKNGGMLSPGDPIRLLWDIEQAYPSMTA